MEPLPIRLVAWIFTVAGLAALMAGGAVLTLMFKAEKLPTRNSGYSTWNDIMLLGVWGISFIAGMGLLNNKPWAATLLEYFCWVLIVLTLMSAGTRLKIMKDKFEQDPAAGPFRWPPAIIGALLVVVPIVALCGATIYTLHDDGVRKALRAAERD